MMMMMMKYIVNCYIMHLQHTNTVLQNHRIHTLNYKILCAVVPVQLSSLEIIAVREIQNPNTNTYGKVTVYYTKTDTSRTTLQTTDTEIRQRPQVRVEIQLFIIYGAARCLHQLSDVIFFFIAHL